MYFSEPFTRMQAWIDMLIIANHKKGFFFIRGNKVTIERGQIGMGNKKLAERWSWSRGKATRYLNELEKQGQIVQQKNNLTSIISIVNYDLYQKGDTADETADDTTDSTANGQQTDINNKNNKNNNILFIKGEQKIISESLFKTLNSLLADQLYLETICMNNSIRNIEDMKDYLKSFFVELENRGENYKDEADAKYHFASWLKKELKESESKSKPPGRRSDKVTPENINDIWK